jgi:signal transduction histidine kinase
MIDEVDRVFVIVEDNGIGIRGDDFLKIFSPMQRLENQSDYEGTGLGLTICQRIVQRQGGAIWCTSKEGHGSQFHIRFSAPNNSQDC